MANTMGKSNTGQRCKIFYNSRFIAALKVQKYELIPVGPMLFSSCLGVVTLLVLFKQGTTCPTS
jgi:hypothetical protein